jgi:DNA-binding MarR family transcriptional regulator
MHIVLQVLATAQALEKAAHRVFKPHGVTPAQFNVLNLLADQPAGLRASDLAQALIVDPSNVTGLLKRMKKDRLLEELANAGDRRTHIVGLTPRGKAVWAAAAADYERCLAAVESGLGRANRTGADKVLRQLGANAERLP